VVYRFLILSRFGVGLAARSRAAQAHIVMTADLGATAKDPALPAFIDLRERR
jgi:hypothetical protein